MKSEALVRAHRDDLRRVREMSCDCAGTAHEVECLIGSRMMYCAEQTLSWALGENDAMDAMVEEMAKRVREVGG
jgi:hypothetical protein